LIFLRLSIVVLLSVVGFSALADEQYIDEFWQDTRSKISHQKIPGFSMVFIERNRAPRYFNTGLTEKGGQPVNEQTLFRLASVSKTFTGGLTAKLVHKGQLNWQQPLQELAPDFSFSANNRNITLEHLLSQSSGLMRNAYDNLIEAEYPLPKIIDQLKDLDPLCQPGKCYTYQNALFGVLEYHFQQNNTSYGRVLEQELLTPLNMYHTSVGREPLMQADDWAKPHVLTRARNWTKTRLNESYYRVSPAAGINTNSHDMGIWLKAMLGEYPDVIEPEIISEITQPHIRTSRELRRRAWRNLLDNAHYGLGWRVYEIDGLQVAYHSGWVKGYRAEVSFCSELGIGVAMLMNAEANLMNELGADFWSGYLAQQTHKVSDNLQLSAGR